MLLVVVWLFAESVVLAKIIWPIETWVPRITFCVLVETRINARVGLTVFTMEVLRLVKRDEKPVRLPEMPQLLKLAPAGKYLILRRDYKWYGYRISKDKNDNMIIHSVHTKFETFEDIKLSKFKELLEKYPYQK